MHAPPGRSGCAAAVTGTTTPSGSSRPHRQGLSCSTTFVSPRPRGPTSRRARTPRWGISSPRRTAIRCSNSTPSAKPALATVLRRAGRDVPGGLEAPGRAGRCQHRARGALTLCWGAGDTVACAAVGGLQSDGTRAPDDSRRGGGAGGGDEQRPVRLVPLEPLDPAAAPLLCLRHRPGRVSAGGQRAPGRRRVRRAAADPRAGVAVRGRAGPPAARGAGDARPRGSFRAGAQQGRLRVRGGAGCAAVLVLLPAAVRGAAAVRSPAPYRAG